MDFRDSAERARSGLRQQSELLATPAAEPRTLLEASWRDYVFAEVWTRPDLDRRSRYLVAMAGAAGAPGPAEILDGYIRGALACGELSLAELREAALQLAVYGGWSRGAAFDAAVSRTADSLGLPSAATTAVRSDPCRGAARDAQDRVNFQKAMAFASAAPTTPFTEAASNFLFGDIWVRPGLDQRARRWITLVCAADSGSDVGIRTHTYAAMATGNATVAEMYEFVLQYAIHGGWPRATAVETMVRQMSERIAKGLGPFA